MSTTDYDAIYEPLAEEDKPPYPLGASKWGKNMMYHYCVLSEQRKNVAICMTLLDHFDQGKSARPGYESCFDAIKSGECPAIKMRQEEVEAGESLYYMPKRRVKISHGKVPEKRKISITQLPTKKPAKPRKTTNSDATKEHEVDLLGADMASVITALAKDEMVQSNSKVNVAEEKSKKEIEQKIKINEPVKAEITNQLNEKEANENPVIKRLPGESVLAFARRRKSALHTRG